MSMPRYYRYRNAWLFEGAPHNETLLDRTEQKAVLKQGGLLIRNTYDFDCPEQTTFWNVIKDHFEGLEGLTANTKSRVNKALEGLEIKLTDFSLFEQQGYDILKATYEDYAVSDHRMDRAYFTEYLARCQGRDYDCWGIFDKSTGKMVGFQTIWLWGDSCQLDLIGVLPEYKRNQTFPYYGLFYTVSQYYLQEKGLRYITDGTRSITEHSNIQSFLEEKFHFRKSYCHLAIHYQWWMKIAVKMLYPFRKIITGSRVKAILNMESMTRPSLRAKRSKKK